MDIGYQELKYQVKGQQKEQPHTDALHDDFPKRRPVHDDGFVETAFVDFGGGRGQQLFVLYGDEMEFEFPVAAPVYRTVGINEIEAVGLNSAHFSPEHASLQHGPVERREVGSPGGLADGRKNIVGLGVVVGVSLAEIDVIDAQEILFDRLARQGMKKVVLHFEVL